MTRTAITMSERASGISMRCTDSCGRCDRRDKDLDESLDEDLAVHRRFRPQARGDA